MMDARRWIGVCALTLLAAPAFAQRPAAAGRIKLATGEVFVVRGGTSEPAKVGQEVYESDSLRTGSDGRLGVTLIDDTRVSLGPGSEGRAQQLSVDAGRRSAGSGSELRSWMAVYVSGKIAKLAPDSIRLETPGAIVGVRGTTVAIQVVQ